MLHYIDCGLPDVWLQNGYTIEETPYGRAVSIRDLDGLHRAIGLYIAHNCPVLTRHGFKFLRKEMDLSQTALAGLIGVVDSTIRHWESGRGDIPSTADRLMRVLYVEYTRDGSEIRQMIEQIGDMVREARQSMMLFGNGDNGWRPIAA